MRLLGSILLCTLLVSCTPGDDAEKTSAEQSSQSAATQIATTYRSLRVMTGEPAQVNQELAELCRGVNEAEVERARKTWGPHAYATVMIYMNDPAATTFGKLNASYPVGSVIVKEKHAYSYRSATQPSNWIQPNDGVGGMIKRSPGYDPAHGDWEYFYFEDPSKVESGKMISCIQCHTGAAGQDYVFGTWAHQIDAR